VFEYERVRAGRHIVLAAHAATIVFGNEKTVFARRPSTVSILTRRPRNANYNENENENRTSPRNTVRTFKVIRAVQTDVTLQYVILSSLLLLLLLLSYVKVVIRPVKRMGNV
jgi:hypothetical protein